ncbi:MAG: TolC family protein [Methylococcales bacterium]
MSLINQYKLTYSLLALLMFTSVTGNADDKTALQQTFNLDKAISYALDNNPDLQIAAQRIKQAEAQLGEALAVFYPQLSAKISYEHSDNPAQVFAMIVAQREFDANSIQHINNPGSRQNFRPELIGKLSLFRGGQDYYRSKAAELGIASAELEQSALRNALTQSVTVAYYGYLAALEALKIAQDAITVINSELTQTRHQYEGGTVLKSDLLSLQVKLAQAQEDEIKAKNAIDLAMTSIKTLLATPTGMSFTLVDNQPLQTPALPAVYSELLTQALAQRPELKAAANQIAISEKQSQTEQGAYLPRVDAYVSYGQNSQNPDFSSNKDNVTAGVSIEMDLFTGLSTKHRVSAAQHKVAEAREAQRKMQISIEQDVKSAYLKLSEALARINVNQASMAAAEEAFRLVNEERAAGIATVTRYIEAEVARNNAQAAIIAARFDALSAEATLKMAIGDALK